MRKIITTKRPFLKMSYVSYLFLLTIVFSCKKSGSVDEKKVVERTEATKAIQAGSSVIGRFISDQTFVVSEGITQTQITYKSNDSLPMSIYLLKVDLNNPKLSIQAIAANETNWGFQRLTEMCRLNQLAGTDIMAAVNADFYNTSTGEPVNTFYVNGTARKQVSTQTLAETGRPFFVYYKDRSLKMGGYDRTGGLRPIDYAQVDQAVGGGHWLVDNGVKTVHVSPVEPRTAVGYTTGKIVYTLVADGRQAKYSNGLTLNDTRDILYSLGVVDAINLDGGGSTTMALKTGTTWSVTNKPSDTQGPRSVANGLAFVLKK